MMVDPLVAALGMLRHTAPPALDDKLFICDSEMPLPSSWTLISTSSTEAQTTIFALLLPEWRSTLVSPSCATRKSATSFSGAKRQRSGGRTSRT